MNKPGHRARVLMVGLGGPTFISDWARAVARFSDVVGITTVSELPTEARFLARGIALGSVEGFDTLFVRRRKLRPSRIFWRVNIRLEEIVLRRALRAFENNTARFQIVHSHFYSSALAISRVARSISAFHMHTEHSSNLVALDPTMHPSGAGRRMLSLALATVSELFVVSDSLAAGLIRYGIARPVQVVPNPVDETLFSPGSEAPSDLVHLLTVGSLIKRKDHRLLLEAFALLAGLVSRPLHLTVVGDGELRGDLEQLAAKLGLTAKVNFKGWLSRADVAALFRRSDIYVHTSKAESFCVAVAEALMSGLPVVARRSGGLTDQIGPEQGASVANPSIRSIAEALSTVITNLDCYDGESIAANARQCFSIGSVSEKIFTIYRPYLELSAG